jgi:hypothetical protein
MHHRMSGYILEEGALQWLEGRLPSVAVVRRARESWKKTDATHFDLTLFDYRACVAFLPSVLARKLQSLPEFAVRLVSMMESTFGVFVPGNSTAVQQQVETTFGNAGWPPEACISGQDKVLVCSKCSASR